MITTAGEMIYIQAICLFVFKLLKSFTDGTFLLLFRQSSESQCCPLPLLREESYRSVRCTGSTSKQNVGAIASSQRRPSLPNGQHGTRWSLNILPGASKDVNQEDFSQLCSGIHFCQLFVFFPEDFSVAGLDIDKVWATAAH